MTTVLIEHFVEINASLLFLHIVIFIIDYLSYHII